MEICLRGKTDLAISKLMICAHTAIMLPLVDVVKGPQTDDAVIKRIVAVLREMGKKPVVFKKFIAGYLALRMMVVGVVQRIDFGGLDLTAINLEKPSFTPAPDDYKPTKVFDLVKAGHLGVKTGRGFYDYGNRTEAEVCKERDVKLLKLLKLLQAE